MKPRLTILLFDDSLRSDRLLRPPAGSGDAGKAMETVDEAGLYLDAGPQTPSRHLVERGTQHGQLPDGPSDE